MTEGVRFLYDVLPALGSNTNNKSLPSYSQAVSQPGPDTPPVSLAQNPVEQGPAGEALVQGAVKVKASWRTLQHNILSSCAAKQRKMLYSLQDALAAQRPTVTALSDAEDFLPFNLAAEPAARNSPASEAAARNQQDTAGTSGSDDLPWATDVNLSSPLLRLHHGTCTARRPVSLCIGRRTIAARINVITASVILLTC